MTRARDGKAVEIDSFSSRQDILRAMHASCHIPSDFHPMELVLPRWMGGRAEGTAFDCPRAPTLGGERYVDGAFAFGTFAPLFGDSYLSNTFNLIITPFSIPSLQRKVVSAGANSKPVACHLSWSQHLHEKTWSRTKLV